MASVQSSNRKPEIRNQKLEIIFSHCENNYLLNYKKYRNPLTKKMYLCKI